VDIVVLTRGYVKKLFNLGYKQCCGGLESMAGDRNCVPALALCRQN